MNKRLKLFMIGSAVLLAIGCNRSDLIKKTVNVQDYSFEITVLSRSAELNNALDEAEKALKRRVSVFKGAKSELAQLNILRGPMAVSPEFEDLLKKVSQYSDVTNHVWNPVDGKLRRLWGLDKHDPYYPPPDSLMTALDEISLTLLVRPDSGQAQLTGVGLLDLDRMALGWAVDGAAEAMLAAGVKSGMISIGSIYRTWGAPGPERRWEVPVYSPEKDSLRYRMEPPAGGMVEINLDRDGFSIGDSRFLPIFDIETGMPLSEPFSATATAPSCAEAAALAEASLNMTRSEVFDELLKRLQPDSVGFFIIYSHDVLGYSAEASPLLSSRITVDVP